MKKKVFRERYRKVDEKEYRNPYIEDVVVKDELFIDDKGNKKVKRTMTKKKAEK